MIDAPIIAGPPPAEFEAVEGFLPRVDFENDSTYGALVADMAPEDVELAKALLVCNGVAANAGRMLWPEIPDATAKKRASRGANDARVRALLDHFKTVAESDDKPVTLDEVRRRTIATWRTCKDAKTFKELTGEVMEMEGLSFKHTRKQENDDLASALREADEIMVGMSGQSSFGAHVQ